MSGSDRGGNDPVRLNRWLWPAIIFAVATLAIGGVQHWLHYNDAARNAAAYSRDAQNQIATECTVVATYDNCAREIEQARRANQRNEYDLYAQKAMALWTAIMGGMATVGIALSGVGVYLIWKTWEATREAAENSRSTLDSYIWKERGHVEAVEAEYTAVSPGRMQDGVFLSLKNVGLSPVEIFAINYCIVPEKAWNLKTMDLNAKRVLIPAGETRTGGVIMFHKLSEGWLNGSIEYTTLKNQKFKTYFCFNVEWSVEEPYASDRWRFTQFYPPAMPSNT